MMSREQEFELPVITDCRHYHPPIIVSHNYSGPAEDLSAELTISDSATLLKIRDNGIRETQAVKIRA